jgi:hypothetical protein
MKKYQLLFAAGETKPYGAMYKTENGNEVSFLFDPANTDYQAYLAWVAEGNTPLPADEVTQ